MSIVPNRILKLILLHRLIHCCPYSYALAPTPISYNVHCCFTHMNISTTIRDCFLFFISLFRPTHHCECIAFPILIGTLDC